MTLSRNRVKVPERCLICGSEWVGGHQVPNEPMTHGLRVFYNCGSSMSMREGSLGAFNILLKNCTTTYSR